MFNFLKKIFAKSEREEIDITMKYLVVGLGNIGADYVDTRHNIGFDVVDKIAKDKGAEWKAGSQASYCEVKHKGRHITLIKPTTYMNRSGNALTYWMSKTKVSRDNVLVIVDDLHIDFARLKLKSKGSDGGHNGLKDIARVWGNQGYNRLRVGIGNDFHSGQQVDFVLGKWNKKEQEKLPTLIERAAEATLSFTAIGMKFTMEKFNSK